jgi:hypothetical protein
MRTILFTIALVAWAASACVYGFESELNAAPSMHFLVAASDT